MISRGSELSEPAKGPANRGMEQSLPFSGPPKTIVYGAFKGMGDLLNASPVIAAQLRAGHQVKLLLFPRMGLEAFLQLVDFGTHRPNLEIIFLPVSGGIRAFRDFFSRVSGFQPDLIWISPHAPREASSWKIPLLLWVTKLLHWPRSRLAGAMSEHLSRLFDLRAPVDRSLPLFERESQAFAMLEVSGIERRFPRVHFVDRITRHRAEPPRYDLLIHPGANASNRTWPTGHFASVVQNIPAGYRIAVLGLTRDLDRMRAVLPTSRGIEFIAGSLEDAIIAIARARVLLAMDSGSTHFAQNLDVPTVALFGTSDPGTIIGRSGSVLPIYERTFPCQPCRRAVCYQKEVYCMNAIAPDRVAKAIVGLLNKSSALRP